MLLLLLIMSSDVMQMKKHQKINGEGDRRTSSKPGA
jgi:hypothetical protein